VRPSQVNLKSGRKLTAITAVNTPAPSYSAVASRAVTSEVPRQANPAAVPKYKVIVTPSATCKNTNTADDTRKLLMSKSPMHYGIRADRVVPMRNNAVLVESRCASVLQLTQSDKLKELKLEARHLSKSWPKVQIMDIPESITKEALMDDLSRQNFSEAVPENFIGKMFKYGRKQQNTPGDHASNNTTSWVVELHPAARQQLIKVGRFYTSWKSHTVRDFLQVTRCFNCQRHGHISKHCTSPRQCGYCASTEHDSKTCPAKDDSSKYRCANCLRGGLRDANHHTAQDICPIHKHRTQELINSTLYDVDG
jgi:hypothetical protein